MGPGTFLLLNFMSVCVVVLNLFSGLSASALWLCLMAIMCEVGGRGIGHGGLAHGLGLHTLLYKLLVDAGCSLGVRGQPPAATLRKHPAGWHGS